MQEDDFVEAMRRHRLQSHYFPTINEIIQEHEKLCKEKASTTKLLESPREISEEQRRLNLKYLSKIKRMLRLKIIPKDKPTNRKGEKLIDLTTKHARKVLEQAKRILQAS